MTLTNLRASLGRLDFLGAIFQLTASIFLVVALQETGDGKKWSSPLVLTLLILSGPLWLAFLGYETYLTRASSAREPVMPSRLLSDRLVVGVLL